ncbi:hypothetical protein [Arthrobacter sp. UYCo732]|uniref:hypothetical protein n=1 Tax=Arthrobacter sp. UYCo732 TaxID=3156336 RepID=UPI0033916A99
MSNISMPGAADIAARTATAIRSLNDGQIAAILTSSRRVARRRSRLPEGWATLTKAAPELANTMDDLHAREIINDLPRFEALAKAHAKQLDGAVTTRTGKLTALSVLAAAVLGVITTILGLTGVIHHPLTVAGAGLTGGLLVAAYIGGHLLSRQDESWMFADPEAAAAIVWDAGIDAAAAAALTGRSGSDGITRELLLTLGAVWAGAGLGTEHLNATPTTTSPVALLTARQTVTTEGQHAA